MRGHDLFRGVAILALLLCYATILLGGNVAASDSGLACPDWPSCHGTFFPPLSGGVAIEWSHRLAAFVLSLSIAALTALGVAAERNRPVLLRLAVGSFGLVVAQALLGGLVVESTLSTAVVIFHLGLATALFGVLLVLAFLANFRQIPRRWQVWAEKATEERPTTFSRERTPAADGGRGEGRVPSGLPSPQSP